jgi:site-specific DNA-methyltransferase (cytosine-N4-specific)
MNYVNKILQGDCRKVLRQLPADTFHCCVTSPPYLGLRDYEAGEGEIGREPTVREFITALVQVFSEVHRVLRPDGTLWLNLGDSYSSNGRKQNTHHSINRNKDIKIGRSPDNREKQLLGVPWQTALAMQEEGWFLRQEIIWQKTNAMPESVEDRFSNAHEHIFLFSKSPHYFFNKLKEKGDDGELAAMRSVWKMNVGYTKVKHFASFPKLLPQRCIAAGTSAKGCCPDCGACVVPIVEKTRKPTRPGTNSKIGDAKGKQVGNRDTRRHVTICKTVGWKYSCSCWAVGKCPADTLAGYELGASPCLVLDPFSGSGTTALVAKQMNRSYTGIELNPAYVALSERRLERASSGFGLF